MQSQAVVQELFYGENARTLFEWAEGTARAKSTHTRAAASDNLGQPVRSGESAAAATTTILPDR